MAEFGGSWTFISIFGLFLAGWAVLNTEILGKTAFDPYPYIFLNLMLSMLAAIQAPIIMMSQNRQVAKDRQMAAGGKNPLLVITERAALVGRMKEVSLRSVPLAACLRQ